MTDRPRYASTSSYQSLDNLGSIPASVVETALDTFNIFTHYFDPSPPNLTQIPRFPVTVLSNYSSTSTPWFGPAGLVGLGPSSTLLQHLYDLRLISSRSFGLYMGTAYEQSNGVSNGSLTLGGYDSGRFEDQVYNYTISPSGPETAHSPFKVSVAQMTLTTADGNQTELSDQFDAYITTSQYQLRLPDAVTQRLADVTGATASDDAESVLRLPADFDASLTITLQGGLSVTYDAQWLRNVSNNSPISAGGLSNTTTPSPGGNGTSSAQVNLLGSAFLSSLYLMANYDAQPLPTFHLASALPNAPYVQTVALCANTVPVAAATTKVPSFARAGLTGAIVGGVIGGIGLTFAVWWLLRKCMQRRANKSIEGDGVAMPGHGKKDSKDEGERDSTEMATFAFDFNSPYHHSYQMYLHGQRQAGQKPKSNEVPQQQQHSQSHPQPQSQPEEQYRYQDQSQSHAYARAEEYLRSRDDAYHAMPLTPATGVPLLLSQQPLGQSEPTSSLVSNTYAQPPPQRQPQAQPPQRTDTSLLPASLSHSLSPFPSPTPRRASHESARRQGLGLNVQTEFDGPPTSVPGTGKTKTKQSLLRRVFPPPQSLAQPLGPP